MSQRLPRSSSDCRFRRRFRDRRRHSAARTGHSYDCAGSAWLCAPLNSIKPSQGATLGLLSRDDDPISLSKAASRRPGAYCPRLRDALAPQFSVETDQRCCMYIFLTPRQLCRFKSDVQQGLNYLP